MKNLKILFKILSYNQLRFLTMTNNLQCKAIESLKNNPYFNKYSEKIIEKQKVSPEEFVSRLEEHEKQKRNPKISNMQNETKPFSPGIPKSDRSTNISKNNLEKIMKIDLIKEKSGEEIKQIWEEFHKSKENTISATVPITSFRLIQEKSKIHPIFLLPLPRNQGYEFIMLQFTENEIHFTPLISYQMHKENAPECLTMIYFSEFADNKNIVLMKGEYDKNVINMLEAQCLANQLQLFYGENNEKRNKLMERFTFQPDGFKHMDLITEIECLSF